LTWKILCEKLSSFEANWEAESFLKLVPQILGIQILGGKHTFFLIWQPLEKFGLQKFFLIPI